MRFSRWRAQTAADSNIDDEKHTDGEKKAPWNALDVGAAVLRLWQLISSSIILASSALISHHHRHFWQREAREPSQGPGALVYHIAVLCLLGLLRKPKSSAWRFFATATLVGDLAMMGLDIVSISISNAPAACHGKSSSNFFSNHDMRHLKANHAKFDFGAWMGENTSHHDLKCRLPMFVYALCIISIFTHTFSIALTALQLHRPKMERPADHAESGIPTQMVQQEDQREIVRPLPPSQQYQERTPASSGNQRVVPIPSGSATSAWVDVNQRYVPSSQNQGGSYNDFRADMFEVPEGRASQETTSSINPDIYLVSDGFRPLEAETLPPYSSRPASLCNA
ncbi:hypothetical protein B0T22DRAFT_285733 [Podospora appendiculata]|uniref:Uncharacterized protein n=1 Tax=Podospora appendiculata TaxID=314037 RepID=A0AAE0X1I7_9PEZI|nr:hypothetical protein B0T22DRAFT_285733 [Podospora appendiculata]